MSEEFVSIDGFVIPLIKDDIKPLIKKHRHKYDSLPVVGDIEHVHSNLTKIPWFKFKRNNNLQSSPLYVISLGFFVSLVVRPNSRVYEGTSIVAVCDNDANFCTILPSTKRIKTMGDLFDIYMVLSE